MSEVEDDREEFLKDFSVKSRAFRDIVLKSPDYDAITSSLNTVFALDKKTGFIFIFREKDVYDFLCKEDVEALVNLLCPGGRRALYTAPRRSQ